MKSLTTVGTPELWAGFLIAILFVLFDVEIIFMYPWAVNFKEMGLAGFVEMLIFLSLFLVGFFYILRKGALKWE